MSANAQANLVHDFKSPSHYKAVHVAVSKIHAKLSGDLNVQIKGPGKLRLFFSSKFILFTRKGICRNDKFHSIFLVYNLKSEILTESAKCGHCTRAEQECCIMTY